jgi:hypothetical protein
MLSGDRIESIYLSLPLLGRRIPPGLKMQARDWLLPEWHWARIETRRLLPEATFFFPSEERIELRAAPCEDIRCSIEEWAFDAGKSGLDAQAERRSHVVPSAFE